MLITLDPNQIILIENWVELKRIRNGSENNINQDYLKRHPKFDSVKFPFVVCSGLEYYSLINVKDFFAQEFICSSCKTQRGQQAFFFKTENYGLSFHFASQELSNHNNVHHKWHEMQLKEDYMQRLEHGLLPISNPKQKFEMM